MPDMHAFQSRRIDSGVRVAAYSAFQTDSRNSIMSTSKGFIVPGWSRRTAPTATRSSGASTDAGRVESQAAQLARLESRVRELVAETTKLNTEREILRSAAKHPDRLGPA